uniref:Uncharacterized protein n=1 Tax=Rhizophora mucronata TaxID=61149 RepID=A0A2P2IP16_RHIMU
MNVLLPLLTDSTGLSVGCTVNYFIINHMATSSQIACQQHAAWLL